MRLNYVQFSICNLCYAHFYRCISVRADICGRMYLVLHQLETYLTYIIHSGFISGYQNRYGDNLKPPTNVYHRMTA